MPLVMQKSQNIGIHVSTDVSAPQLLTAWKTRRHCAAAHNTVRYGYPLTSLSEGLLARCHRAMAESSQARPSAHRCAANASLRHSHPFQRWGRSCRFRCCRRFLARTSWKQPCEKVRESCAEALSSDAHSACSPAHHGGRTRWSDDSPHSARGTVLR